MANRSGNKICIDVAADSSSLGSLSFTGLLSIQDQQLKPPSNNQASQLNKQDSEFEFSVTRCRPNSIANDPIKSVPADLLISSHQFQPQACLHQSEQSPLKNHSTSTDTLPATYSSRRSSYDKDGRKDFDKPPHIISKQFNKEHTAPRPWFGQKVFQSIVSPCRECHAVKPTTKGQGIARENV